MRPLDRKGAHMLKEYVWRGYTWQFEESEAPHDAVLLEKANRPANKAMKPANKARTPRKKA